MDKERARSATTSRPRRHRWVAALAFVGLAILLAAVVDPAGPPGQPSGGAAEIGPRGQHETPAAGHAEPPGATPRPGGASPQASGSTQPGSGYLTTDQEMRERSDLARNGHALYRVAIDDLLAFADDALDRSPEPLEPLRIRGQRGPFVEDAVATYGLGIAYAVTGDQRYAMKARELITAWVTTTTRTTDTCTDSGGCHTSLILGRAAPGFVFGADLIESSGVMSEPEKRDFKRWLREVILPAASERINNWGDAGTFTRVVLTDYIGDEKGFGAAIGKWKELMDLVTEEGQIPEETRRGRSGLQYTQEALQYKVAVARVAERRGIDLWSYEGALGGTIKAALDYFVHFRDNPRDWPWHERVRVPPTNPVWEIAYSRFQDPDYVPIILERRPYGNHGHSAVRWTTLTNGIPIEGVDEAAGTRLTP